MMLIFGTIPSENNDIWIGESRFAEGNLLIGKKKIPINRGTAALLTASSQITELLNLPSPIAVISGDNGQSLGSSNFYKVLIKEILNIKPKILVGHYILPNVDMHRKLLDSIKQLDHPPRMIADAGFMYVAKVAGEASRFEAFTPDLGELAFLADEKAPHPAYTRGFIFHRENDIPELVKRAYAYKNVPSLLVLKGAVDMIYQDGELKAYIDKPTVKELEAIGGTGDTLTGILSALLYSNMHRIEAAVKSATINRIAGVLAQPTPATQISEILRYIPPALKQVLN